ncbi:hypothetical protein PR202_gb23407 [Eleusine coracana subsp. coracana]|uniref:Retrotransposon gag domain-containing protein n=1 Tax=Eleusine coracana subsp. coracana TaxID=191504 RepID=A0AAV5FIV9_ELECO|nr:hypothetical protein PR202_gb23407 [Eleusine coracana subsp. coracana]
MRLARGDSYVMANYLPVCLDPAVRIWLTSLPEESITSWGDLNRKLIESFQATCKRPATTSTSLGSAEEDRRTSSDYIKQFCAKKTEIPMSGPNKSLPPSMEGSVAMIWFVRSGRESMTSS